MGKVFLPGLMEIWMVVADFWTGLETLVIMTLL